MLHLSGVDLLDGTPVLDIKPYIPYADSIPAAESGFAPHVPQASFEVVFTSEALTTCRQLEQSDHPDLQRLIIQILQTDPPSGLLRHNASKARFNLRLFNLISNGLSRRGKLPSLKSARSLLRPQNEHWYLA